MKSLINQKINSSRLKVQLLIKNEFETDSSLKLERNQKRKYYLKKMVLNPKKTMSYLTGKVFCIDYVEIVLTTVCTLNCKGCSALMSYYKKPYHITLKKNINALRKLISLCDTVEHLRLLGGEPLCYPELYDVLSFIDTQEKIKKVTIVTNGTLLINNQKIIELLKKRKFNIYISNYGKVSRKKEELIEILSENNINYTVKEDFLWRDYGNLINRNRKNKKLKKQYLNCKIMCTSILDGKLHHCPRSSHGMNLKIIPLNNRDYVNLLDDNTSSEQLRKRLYKFFYGYIPYIEACNYCNSGTKLLKTIKAGIQYKK